MIKSSTLTKKLLYLSLFLAYTWQAKLPLSLHICSIRGHGRRHSSDDTACSSFRSKWNQSLKITYRKHRQSYITDFFHRHATSPNNVQRNHHWESNRMQMKMETTKTEILYISPLQTIARIICNSKTTSCTKKIITEL